MTSGNKYETQPPHVLNRRAFWRTFAGSFTSTPNTETNPSPDSLALAFSSSVENINPSNGPTIAIEAVSDENGMTTMYSLTSHNIVEAVIYDHARGMYLPSSLSTEVPIHSTSSIVGFVNPESLKKELLVVGGHNNSPDFKTKYPTLAISMDRGKTFEPMQLRNEFGEIIEGVLSEMKRIPFSESNLLLSIGDDRGGENKFAIFDTNTRDLKMVPTEFGERPLLDDLYVNPEKPSILSGCGRVVREGSGINYFELDMKSGEMLTSKTDTRFGDLDDVQVLRDENGLVQTTCALASSKIGGRYTSRRVYKIDPIGEVLGFEYGATFDSVLRDRIDPSSYLNREYIRLGVTVVLKKINTTPHGTWVTGLYDTASNKRPFAAFWQIDENSIPDEKTLITYPFDRLLTFPSEITEEPKFVKFQSKNKPHRDGESTHGLYVGLQAGGAGIIPTVKDYIPNGGEELYQKR